MSDDPRERIRSLLVKVGDEKKKVVGNLRGSVSIMKEDIGEHRDTIMISLIECAKYLPTKPGVYGTWLTLMNPDNRVFVADSVNGIYSELRYAIEDGNLEVACCLSRVLIECANTGCVSVSSVLHLVRNLYSAACSSGFSRGDFGLYLVTSSVCWFSPDLALNNAEVSSLIDEIVLGAEAWTSTQSYQSRKDTSNPVPGFPDQLEAAIAAIKTMRQSSWESEVLIRPYMMEGLVLPNFEPEFIHSLPTDDSSLYESVTQNKFVPSVYFRSSSVTLSESDLFLLEETFAATIYLPSETLCEKAKALLRVPFMHAAFEQVLADVIISMSLVLPILVLCQSLMDRVLWFRKSVKPAFENTVTGLLKTNLPSDTQFALMETLFEFTFLNCLAITGIVPVLADTGVMEKFLQAAVRVMPANAIQAKLGAEGVQVSEPGQGQPFESSDEYSMVREVVRIKDGYEVEVIECLINRIDDKNRAFELFVQALIENGARTITHFVKLLELYASVILRSVELGLSPSIEERERVIVQKCFAFWTHSNPFRLEKTLECLLGWGLVSAHTVITSMPIDQDSLVTYDLIELVMGFLEFKGDEYSLTVCANTLLSTCPEPIQDLIVRKYFVQRDRAAVGHEMFWMKLKSQRRVYP